MKKYSMIQECVDSYLVSDAAEGAAVITIKVPRRFVDLWLTKLADLHTSDSEIADFEKSDATTRSP